MVSTLAMSAGARSLNAMDHSTQSVVWVILVSAFTVVAVRPVASVMVTSNRVGLFSARPRM